MQKHKANCKNQKGRIQDTEVRTLRYDDSQDTNLAADCVDLVRRKNNHQGTKGGRKVKREKGKTGGKGTKEQRVDG